MKVPVILEEQEVIMKWARKLRDNHYPVSAIIASLLAEKPSKNHKNDEEYIQAREAYKQWNSAWKENVLLAIHMYSYRKVNDIRQEQIVTNGFYVGVAFDLDYDRRKFKLYYDKSGMNLIGEFKIDDFSAIK